MALCSYITMNARWCFCIVCCFVFVFIIVLVDLTGSGSFDQLICGYPGLLERYALQNDDGSEMVAACHVYRDPDASLHGGVESPIWDGVLTDRIRIAHGQIRAGSENDRSNPESANAAFRPRMDATYRRRMRDLMLVFMEAARRRNLTYFLYGGSLIGSYRHHGMVPWDDDVDVAVDGRQTDELRAIFGGLRKPFKGVISKDRWKLAYGNASIIRTDVPWSYPFLDISFFAVTSRHVQDRDSAWAGKGFRYRTEHVFPLVLRPFWDLWLPAPRDAEAVISATYDDPDVCVTPRYSHARELFLGRPYSVPCSTLYDFYPFVHRRRRRSAANDSAVVELLAFNGSVVHSVRIEQNSCT